MPERPSLGLLAVRTSSAATPTGRAIATIMATLTELELELGHERRAACRESRRIRGLAANQTAQAQQGLAGRCLAPELLLPLGARVHPLGVR